MFTHIAIATPDIDLAGLKQQPGWQQIELQEFRTEEATIIVWRTPERQISFDLTALVTGEVFHVVGNLDGKIGHPHVSA